VDAILALIHRWNLPQFLYNWQTLEAGVLALIAGLITVRVINKQTVTTVRLEQERVASEVDALRKSLAVELRQQIPRALVVYDSLRRWSSKSDGPITARMVESLSRMPAPIVYSANAGKIGLLEGDAMDVVMLYTLLEGARDGADRLVTTYMPPDDISPAVVMGTADAFLAACNCARGVLPRLRTGDASHDAQDETFIQRINAALAARRA
jgi:hypothetical protein